MQDSTAYNAGQVAGAVLVYGALVAVMIAGWSARRSSRRQRDAALASRGIGDAPVGASSLPPIRGTKRLVIAGVLLALALIGQLVHAAADRQSKNAVDKVRVSLPGVLLGAVRNDAQLQSQLDVVEQALPSELKDVDAGYYNAGLAGVLVTASRGVIESPRAFADEALSDPPTAAGRYTSAPAPIDAGPLGGFARCATVTQTEPAPGTIFACVFVSATSFIMTLDNVASNLDEAADRGRQIRALVVRPVDNPLPSSSTSPAARPAVTLRLPPVLLGATIQRKDVAKERAEFVRLSKHVLTQADLALYVSRTKTFLVETAAGNLQLRSVFLRDYERQAAHELGGDLGRRDRIAAGSLGGDAYCWHPTAEDLPAYVCLFVDDASYVAVYGLESKTLSSAADLARQVRAAVEHRG